MAAAASSTTNMFSEGFDLVVAHGSQYGSSLKEIAPDFPKIAFAHGTTVGTFVDEGVPMEKLLRRALPRGVTPGYVNQLLVSFPVPEYGDMGEPLPHPHAPTLIEPLSPRELEVLGLIADGLSNREIAEELFIAITTVKKHVSNILGKLGVTNRTHAVARARELGLV